MRRKISTSSIIPLLFLFTLGGCLGPDYLVTSTDPAVAEEAASLREGDPHYTSRRAASAPPEIVRLAIDDHFTLYERAKILRAVNEWNHVLNGYVKFDIDPKADHGQFWAIVPMRGGRPPPVNGVIFGHALAATQSALPVGGLVTVYVDRVRGYDLTSVMRHELGHVLGLDHDPNGRLMSSHYTAKPSAVHRSRRRPSGCSESRIATGGAQLVRRGPCRPRI